SRLAIYQAASNTSVNLTGTSGPVRIQGARVTGDFFEVMNVVPVIGRTITTDDEQPGRDHVAVLGFDLWRQYFCRETPLVEKSVRLNDEDYLVVGVLPAGFQFPSGLEMPAGQQFVAATEIWTPLTTPAPSIQNDRVTNSFRAVARLRTDVSVAQAQSEMAL